MRQPGRFAAIALLLIAPLASAQSLFFGEPLPQTHTRYGAAGASPRLASNGQDAYLFWATDTKLRVTRLVDGQKRAGRPVLSGNITSFDVVWTGTSFLVAAQDTNAQGARRIRTVLVSASGEAISVPVTVVEGGAAPRLALSGGRVLLTYAGDMENSSMLLRPDGLPSTDPHQQPLGQRTEDFAVAPGAAGFAGVAAHQSSVEILSFLPSSELEETRQFATPPMLPRRVAAAGNGQDVLAAWTHGSGNATIDYVVISATGNIGPRTTLPNSSGATDVAVTWTGTEWLVSAIANGKLQTRRLDGSEVHAQGKAAETSPVSLVTVQGRTLAAWRGTGAGQMVLLRDVDAAGNGDEAAFAAADQTLHTTASSHESALLVWSELRDGKRTLHAGIRSSDGNWQENRIGSTEDAILAASDGLRFLVVRKSADGWSAVTLGESAEILASTPVIRSFTPTGITWDGTSYVVIGIAGGKRVYLVRVMTWGEVSTPLVIEEAPGDRAVENARIAAGGGGFLAIWQDSKFTMCFPICDPYESQLRGTRLTSTLQRVDPLNVEIAPDEAVSPDVFWDGTRFQLFWLDDGAVETRSLRPDAAGSGTTRIAGVQMDTGELDATLTPFGTALTSNDGEMLLIRNNELAVRYPLGNPNSRDALVNVGGDVAYVQAQRRDEMPYHGASHVLVRTGGVLPRDTMPLTPKMTRATVTNNGREMLLEWTPPLDAIRGYKLEYRVDDGTWNEFDAWFPATTTSVSIEPWLNGVRYQFRVRAFNDAGASDYSLPATVRSLGRRRALR